MSFQRAFLQSMVVLLGLFFSAATLGFWWWDIIDRWHYEADLIV